MNKSLEQTSSELTEKLLNPDSPEELLKLARFYRSHNLSVIPVRSDATKSPALESLSPYFDRVATDKELKVWFLEEKHRALAIVCGHVSGGLGVLDFDDNGSCFEEFRSRVLGYPGGEDLFKKLPAVRTPSGGAHLYYRTLHRFQKMDRSYRLSIPPQVWAHDERNGEEETQVRRVLIETRGERCYVLAPGSSPDAHPSKKNYVLFEESDLAKIPTLTEKEEEILMSSSRSFDNIKDKHPEPEKNDKVLKALESIKGLGLRRLNPSSRIPTWSAYCPGHNDKNRSLRLVHREKEWKFFCFGPCRYSHWTKIRNKLLELGVPWPNLSQGKNERVAVGPNPQDVFKSIPKDIVVKPTEWLTVSDKVYEKDEVRTGFDAFIPKDRIALIHGPPGCGKSTCLRQIVSSYSHRGLVWYLTEDSTNDAYQRLLLMGANRNGVRICGPKEQQRHPLKLGQGEDSITEWMMRAFDRSLRSTRDDPNWSPIPDIIVFDTLKLIMLEGMINSNEGTTQALAALRMISDSFLVTFAGTNHNTKYASIEKNTAQEMSSGSVSWYGGVDAGWLLTVANESELARKTPPGNPPPRPIVEFTNAKLRQDEKRSVFRMALVSKKAENVEGVTYPMFEEIKDPIGRGRQGGFAHEV